MSRFRICFLGILMLLLAGCQSSGVRPSGEAQVYPTVNEALSEKVSSNLPSTMVPDASSSRVVSRAAIDPPQNCPVTRPPDSGFNPPPPYPDVAPSSDEFWYGSRALWTAVPKSGVWSDLPLNSSGYTQKIFWWSEKFSIRDEPEPDLSVSGRRLDAQAAPLNVSRATNAFAGDIKTAMLVGVDFPTTGCWEITGDYKGAELSFVVWIAP
jgi:hypothetical protein